MTTGIGAYSVVYLVVTERERVRVRELSTGDYLPGSRTTILALGSALGSHRSLTIRYANGIERGVRWRNDTTMTIERNMPA